MEVKLNPMIGIQETPLGPVEQESLGVWRVDVYDDELKGEPLCLDQGMLHVGTIGRQNGAAFCENSSFKMFAQVQRDLIQSEVKRLHGNPSEKAPVELPEIPDDDDDTDMFDED